jgi:hypothetical protein
VRLCLSEESRSRFLEIQPQNLDKSGYQYGGGGEMLGEKEDRRSD